MMSSSKRNGKMVIFILPSCKGICRWLRSPRWDMAGNKFKLPVLKRFQLIPASEPGTLDS